MLEEIKIGGGYRGNYEDGIDRYIDKIIYYFIHKYYNNDYEIIIKYDVIIKYNYQS